MSIEAIAAVLHHSKASGSAKLILLGIANHQGDAGAWPAVSTLARYANITVRQAQKQIRVLEESGEVKIDYQAPEITKHTNRYWVTVRCPRECDGSTAHRVNSTTGGGELHDTPGVNSTTPEPSMNHQEPKIGKATRIPLPFVITDEMREWAETKIPGVDIDFETESFIDYWKAKPYHATKVDWPATWRVWMSKTKRTAQSKERSLPKADGPIPRGWVKALHNQGDHFECRPGEFGCK